jgi:hypothetical protein
LPSPSSTQTFVALLEAVRRLAHPEAHQAEVVSVFRITPREQ